MTPSSTAPDCDARVLVFTRTGCQLCPPARDAVAAAAAAAGLDWTEVVIDADPELRAEYGDRVPVVELDGEAVAELVVDAAELAAALRVASRG